MKNYPKALADVAVLKEVLDFLYNQAESAQEQASYYAEQLKEQEEKCSWSESCMVEHKAKAEAYVRLAERLAK